MTINDCFEAAAQVATEYFNKPITVDHILGKSRRREYSLPRQVVTHIVKAKFLINLTELGKIMNRDHTTIIHSCQTVDNLLWAKDDKYVDFYNRLDGVISSLGKEQTAVITLPLYSNGEELMNKLKEHYNITGYIIGTNQQAVNY